MATTLLMAHYWILHKHCQPEPPPPPPVFFFPPPFITARRCFFLSAPLSAPSFTCQWSGDGCVLGGGGRLRPFLQVQRRPGSLPHDSLSSIHTLHLDLKRRQEKNQVTQAARSGRGCRGRGYGEGGGWMWSHLIVESLYSEWWQSALWLCSVHWALRLKPYTGKAPLSTLQPSQPPPADLGLSNVLIFTRKKSTLGRCCQGDGRWELLEVTPRFLAATAENSIEESVGEVRPANPRPDR